MQNLRINFSKGEDVKYISHLDLNRAMTRAINRAGLPIYYTEGFNPHPYLVFAQPLSVGFTGENELMDIKLMTDMPFDDVMAAMNNSLPEGLRINEVYESVEPLKKVEFAKYNIHVEFDNKNPEKAINDFFGMDSITVLKQSKKTQKQVELAPYLKDAEYKTEGNVLSLAVTLPCSQTDNINPSLIITAIENECTLKSEYTMYSRVGFLDADKKTFR